ncbi:MAG: hypothetical protein HOV81_16625, partial [Kofleriaceae bacterium]|nr:hypothetical protein [Kofleriaceae bacterium]
GGFNMFPLAILGVTLLVTAVRFALEANTQRLALIRALTLTVVFSAITGTIVGFATTAKYVVNVPEAAKDPLPYLLQGFAESVTNAVLGGSCCLLAWLLVAVGVRRMPKDV